MKLSLKKPRQNAMIVACIYCQTVCYVPTVEILKVIRERKLEEIEQYKVEKNKKDQPAALLHTD